MYNISYLANVLHVTFHFTTSALPSLSTMFASIPFVPYIFTKYLLIRSSVGTRLYTRLVHSTRFVLSYLYSQRCGSQGVRVGACAS